MQATSLVHLSGCGLGPPALPQPAYAGVPAARLTFRLPKSKLEDGALEQAVRNPTIAKMQLEMKDL